MVASNAVQSSVGSGSGNSSPSDAGHGGGGSYILIGSDHSLYTGKLRAYLCYKRIPFEQLTASLATYKQVILPRTGVAFIPVLVCPDRCTVLQDSHAIMRQLEQQLPAWPVLPRSPCQAFASQLLELFGDEWLLLPAMHYRWSFPQQQQLLHYQFGSTNAPHAPFRQQLDIGRRVAARFSGMLGPLGITAGFAPVIEARFAWQLAALQQHLEQHPFLLSRCSPCSGEFGFMGPLFAHLCRDPVPAQVVKCSAPLVAAWVERVAGVAGTKVQAGHRPILALVPSDPSQPARGVLSVQRAGGPSPAECGSTATTSSSSESNINSSSSSSVFLQCDEVPETLLPLLHQAFQEQVPVINSTLALLKAWMDQQQRLQAPISSSSSSSTSEAAPGAGSPWVLVPRRLGQHSFVLCDAATGQPGHRGVRSASSYVAWRAALIAEWFHALGSSDKQAVMRLLHRISSAGPGSSFYDAATAGARAAAAAYAAAGSAVEPAAGVAAQASVSVSSSSPGSEDAVAAGATASSGSAEPRVDAAAGFAELLRLVAACGPIRRVNNRVAVQLPAPAVAAAPGASASASDVVSKL